MVTRFPRSPWRHAWLPIAGLAGVAMTWIGAATGPFDPTSQQLGANWPGEFAGTLQTIAIEIALLYALLRPWSYGRNWGRALIATLLVATLAAVAFGILFLHGSRIGLMHVIWLGLVAGGLFVTAVISASAAVSETSQAAA